MSEDLMQGPSTRMIITLNIRTNYSRWSKKKDSPFLNENMAVKALELVKLLVMLVNRTRLSIANVSIGTHQKRAFHLHPN